MRPPAADWLFPYRKYLGLVRIQLESVLHIPLRDIGGTCSENGQAISCVVCVHRKVKLCVVGVLVVSDAVRHNDVSHRAAVDGEQQRSEYRALGYSDFQLGFR